MATDISLLVIDYPTLQARIKNTLNRRDLDAEVPAFIRQSEGTISRDLNTREMSKFIEIDLIGDEATLPSDFMEIENIQIKGVSYSLDSVPRTWLDGKEESSGNAQVYTLQGNSILFYPSPGTGAVAQVRYKARLEFLTDAAPVNWLLQKNQEVYIYGGLVQAALFLQDKDAAITWAGLYDAAIRSVNLDARKALQPTRMQTRHTYNTNEGAH